MSNTIEQLKSELAELEPKSAQAYNDYQKAESAYNKAKESMEKDLVRYRDIWHPIYLRLEETKAAIKALERLAQPEK